jgi:hypothetical protein
VDLLANSAQLQIYGAQANTFVGNAGVIQAFGARNLRMVRRQNRMSRAVCEVKGFDVRFCVGEGALSELSEKGSTPNLERTP